MKYAYIKILLGVFIGVTVQLYSADQSISKKHHFVIPDLSGDFYSDVEMPANTTYHYSKTPFFIAKTPFFGSDLGQTRCQKCLAEIVQPLQKNNNIITIHGISQGSVTAMNYTSKKPENITGLVLDSPFASGNSAIHHVMKNIFPRIANCRGSYYILPYMVRLFLPYYSPGGQQPIYSIEKIPNTTKVIIIHSKKDKSVPITDAQALYYRLRMQGNQNAYFIQKPGRKHGGLLGDSKRSYTEKEKKALEKENLFVCHILNNIPVDPKIKKEYQPNPHQFKPAYDNLIASERKIRAISYGFTATTILGIGYIACRYIPYFSHLPAK
ncbi:MAG TPA: prolyl oligopeptidase family serine peptidase [Candidatus Babeliales bacterium]|nr:prolyl oligopeptidase family serine peptidase [Candidatus Babeliales bacterium]